MRDAQLCKPRLHSGSCLLPKHRNRRLALGHRSCKLSRGCMWKASANRGLHASKRALTNAVLCLPQPCCDAVRVQGQGRLLGVSPVSGTDCPRSRASCDTQPNQQPHCKVTVVPHAPAQGSTCQVRSTSTSLVYALHRRCVPRLTAVVHARTAAHPQRRCLRLRRCQASSLGKGLPQTRLPPRVHRKSLRLVMTRHPRSS